MDKKLRYMLCALMFLIVGAAQSALASGDSAALKASFDALRKVKSYRTHTTIVSQGKSSTLTTEVVIPNRMHITKQGMEMIVVPGGTYQKSGDGKWHKSKINMSAMMDKALGSSEFTDKILKDAQVRLIGPNTINGKPMMVYKVIYTTPEIKSNSRIWIGTDDHLPYKTETTYDGNSKSTTFYTDFNAPVSIVAPTL